MRDLFKAIEVSRNVPKLTIYDDIQNVTGDSLYLKYDFKTNLWQDPKFD